jgi:hypothetical protein
MITDKGKEIIGKYLLGQAPAYASYIAIGCGAQPLQTLDPYGDYSAKENLDFEMFRVPISSRGFVNDGGTEKLVLTAELPTEERYEITEIGIYSAGSNPSAGAFDSKTVFAFTQGENWQYHTASAASTIPTITTPLDESDDNVISTTDKVFQTNADNSIFYKDPRPERYERCRFLNNIILIRGDDSDLTIDSSTGSSAGHFVVEPGSNHIHLTGADIDFSRNSPKDELRLAFSIISKDGDSLAVPDTVRILVTFAETDVENVGEFASFEADLDNGSGTGGTYDFETNRYYVITKKLEDLYQSSGFTWNAVTVVKIYACAIVSDNPSDDYYIALDAMRLENTQTVNPLYGLTGYSVVKNTDAQTVVKSPNTSNYIEFRFSVGVT